MNSLIPSYAMLAIQLKRRQGKVVSALSFSVWFMQMSYLINKQKIHLLKLIIVIYLFRRRCIFQEENNILQYDCIY